MPQQLSYLTERGTMAQHLSRQSVTKLVGPHSWGVDASTLEGMPHNRTNCTWPAKPCDRGSGAQKHTTTCATRSPTNQVCSDRFADVDGQWQLVALPALTSHVQTSGAPVDIIQFKCCYFPGAAPQSSKQKQNGIVATTGSASSIDAG
jgi:hypothetical protein